ncbi:MAG: DUF4040 domain-containing protein [Elusimicrobia bacterium]|nr:DUF4040 domain-containing protein [Elusimicrobiota bacterium]
MLSIQLLIIFLIITAIIAIELKDMISSVIAVGALGLGLSLSFLLLKSPDLAMVLLIVEVVTLTFLVKATVETSHVERKGTDILFTTTIFIFVCFFLILGYEAISMIPEFGSPIMKTAIYYLEESFSRTNSTNMVSSISIFFRGYDSLAGILVLFAVTIGIKSITDKTRRKK